MLRTMADRGGSSAGHLRKYGHQNDQYAILQGGSVLLNDATGDATIARHVARSYSRLIAHPSAEFSR